MDSEVNGNHPRLSTFDPASACKKKNTPRSTRQIIIETIEISKSNLRPNLSTTTVDANVAKSCIIPMIMVERFAESPESAAWNYLKN